jgi:hypothetical protein
LLSSKGIKLWQNRIENLCDVRAFHTQNGIIQGDALLPLLFNFVLKNTIRKVQGNLEGLKLNGTHQILVYSDDVYLFGGNINATKKTQKLSSMLVTRF